jgi:nitrogen fixation protein FixH
MSAPSERPKNDEKAARPPGRLRWLGDPILLLVLGVIAMFVVTNGIMLWVSWRSEPELVQRDYYEASKRYDRVIAAKTQSAGTGWRVTVAAGGTGRIVVRVVDREGRPLAGLAGTARAYRPADPALDQVLAWAERAGTPGSYEAGFSQPVPGLWEITLDLERGGERFYRTFRHVAP